MQAPSADPLIGSTVDGRYLVLSKVADGGMSAVYLATDLRLSRNIALKIVPPHLASNHSFITRLQREAQSAASLSHPHVVQIHDYGTGGEHAYLVYEFIDGFTLRDVVRDHGALTAHQALELLDPIIEGLAAAHHAGLVHRDVKPENVLISRQGWVKIGDFGLSRAVTTTTATTTPMGTVAYLAPELARGQGGDARSDIYSAGIMLYELLTGRPPFNSEMPLAVVVSHLQDPVPEPSLLLPGLPQVMDELVRYMTEKDPDHRPPNGTELLQDLRHIRQTLPAEPADSAQPLESILAVAARGADRRRAAAAAGAGGSLAAGVHGAPGLADADAARAGAGPGKSGPVSEHATLLPAATEALPHTADFTDVLPPAGVLDGAATTALPAPHFPTSVLPPRNQLYTEDPEPAQLTPPAPSSPPPVPRQSKRQAALAAKARAKEAATPSVKLGPARPRRRAVLWILLVALLAVLAASAGWFLTLGPGAMATVPDVHNKNMSQAEALLRAAGFEAIPAQEIHHETVAAGLVVETDPAAGASVRKFNAITLRISLGPVLYSVPNLVGKPAAEAKALLSEASLAVGTVTEAYDEKVAAGLVVSQDPGPGKEFRANTKINMVASKGPKPIPVPSLTGKSQADAEAALKAAGLKSALGEPVNSMSVPQGAVVSQSPASGELKAGESVTLVISLGPRMIDVPNYVGKQVGVAKSELEALGFKVAVENLLGGFFGTVRFQEPPGGQAPEGSTITLRVI